MKKTLAVVIGVTALALAGLLGYFALHKTEVLAASGATTMSDVVITLTEQGYSPDVLTVKEGTTVHFKTALTGPHWPASNPHPQHSILPQFDPRVPIDADKEWAFKFDRIGHFGFHDHIHSYYTGTIDVVK